MSRTTQVPAYQNMNISSTRLSRSSDELSISFDYVLISMQRRSYNPTVAGTIVVWAFPRSLATTCGLIVIFSSYGYLDVSVPHVCSLTGSVTGVACRVAPFGDLRIKGYLLLPATFRSLSRPSSPPRA